MNKKVNEITSGQPEENNPKEKLALRDKDLLLREAVVADARQLTDWWNDGQVMEHAGFPKGLNTTLEETQTLLENADPQKMVRLIIEVDGVSVGECSFRIIGRQAEIGIKLCAVEYQNRGYGTRALRLMIGQIFANDQIEKIVLDTNIDNKRSQHVYHSLGFKKVATRYDAWQDQLGRWQTAVDFELTREDWYARN